MMIYCFKAKGYMAFSNLRPSTLLSLSIGLALFFSCFIASAQSEGLSEYTLGAGDTIRIQVYGHDKLTTESTLSDAGTLSFPFLGELRVLGLTVGQLQSNITTGLKEGYLLDPNVTVSLISYRNVYIEGEVARPGGYPFRPGLTVRKAISLAEGFTDLASRSKIYLISESDPEKKPRRVSLEDQVNPGDVITVEESFF